MLISLDEEINFIEKPEKVPEELVEAQENENLVVDREGLSYKN